ncbi:transformer-2 protein homolog alpha isoform X3 [Phyllopteryx taeniolatus]|uniref:transformer-2 protein homolog alpha isoform X3 n=1 Tax=Phyllopteryx taeniolatus TaxID=161469 RepID=UPI002AD48B0C|nr:transformer-2 protein homolog alpha isoform X3 [Phyllopteryx taeniolatus]
MSDEGDHIRRGSRSPSKSEHGSPTQAKSESRSGSQSGSRASKHSESRSRSRSKSGSRSKHDSNRHASRSRSPSHRCRQRSRSLSNSPESRRRKSTSPMSNRSRQAERRANPDPSKCLGVFGLSLDTTARDLREVFSQYGPLSGVNVVFHQRSGRSRGFAFVYFERLEDSKQAMEQANGMKLDGRQIRVDYSITKRAHSPTPGIYMGKDIRDDGGGGGTWRGRGSFYNRGYDRGYERGYERSYERSYERNYDRGYDRSYDRGYDRGSDRGYDRGCDRGYDRGYDRYDRCDEYDYRYSRRHSPSPDYGRYRSSSWSRSYNPRRY